MRFNIEQLSNAGAELEPSKRYLVAWLALAALLLAGVVCLAGSARSVIQLSTALRNSKQSAAMQGSSVARRALVSATQFESSQEGVSGFVAELPLVAPSDPQIRYAAKLAHEQRVSIVQMQTEFLKADPKALGQSRITLQLRGDYRDIKNVWIALLAKYPGLVLERLNLRHHTDGLPAPAPLPTATALQSVDRADDEATIEMIQYTRPSETAR
jgi:hypothetical protein